MWLMLHPEMRLALMGITAVDTDAILPDDPASLLPLTVVSQAIGTAMMGRSCHAACNGGQYLFCAS
ncbi:hypothetical protein SAMN05421863_10787 [Nitrosomonas communis]|uniref:Uncharacterized protein n=1 Tax=Nitrosomonas communis TaxID=44574 RepID=A0A1I4V9C7_9PROT|nr:hypothetical protein SAMN05421863_10787 [Nitrosomonas communis]